MTGVDQNLDRVAERGAMVRALAALPIRQRQVLVLRYFEDLSVEETAQLLHCTTGTVKAHAARGLARLRDLLIEADDQPLQEVLGLLTATLDLYVDPETYLPLRVVAVPAVGGANPVAVDLTWLPRTDENLALLELPIPDGYTYHEDPIVPEPGQPVG